MTAAPVRHSDKPILALVDEIAAQAEAPTDRPDNAWIFRTPQKARLALEARPQLREETLGEYLARGGRIEHCPAAWEMSKAEKEAHEKALMRGRNRR